MAIVPNVNPLPDVSGAVLIGTVAGSVLYTAPYETSDGAPVAPQLLKAFQLCWNAVPDVLGLHGSDRFDLVVRQRAEGCTEEAITYWQSGLSAGALCGLIARRLRQLRAAVDTPQRPHTKGVEVTEVIDAIEWVPPAKVDHSAAVLQQLSDLVWGEYR